VSRAGGAPISWSGGHSLSLLAPGLGYRHPEGDSWEIEDVADPFLRLPDDPVELGTVLADWTIETESAVAAALALEPLDPHDELDLAEREAWDERLGEVTVSFETDVPKEAQRALRDSLAKRSELYRRTLNALGNPHSQDGRALAAALDAAIGDGVVGLLTSGEWSQ